MLEEIFIVLLVPHISLSDSTVCECAQEKTDVNIRILCWECAACVCTQKINPKKMSAEGEREREREFRSCSISLIVICKLSATFSFAASTNMHHPTDTQDHAAAAAAMWDFQVVFRWETSATAPPPRRPPQEKFFWHMRNCWKIEISGDFRWKFDFLFCIFILTRAHLTLWGRKSFSFYFENDEDPWKFARFFAPPRGTHSSSACVCVFYDKLWQKGWNIEHTIVLLIFRTLSYLLKLI